jgi:hypothetical protein
VKSDDKKEEIKNGSRKTKLNKLSDIARLFTKLSSPTRQEGKSRDLGKYTQRKY